MSIEAAFFGSIGRDGEGKTSKGGKPYLRLNIRVGNDEAAQWVNVTAFDETAIKSADKFVKGGRVYVEGRISLNEWSAQDGTKRAGLSCLAWHCRLSQIGRAKPKRTTGDGESLSGQAVTPQRSAAAFDDALPF